MSWRVKQLGHCKDTDLRAVESPSVHVTQRSCDELDCILSWSLIAGRTPGGVLLTVAIAQGPEGRDDVHAQQIAAAATTLRTARLSMQSTQMKYHWRSLSRSDRLTCLLWCTMCQWSCQIPWHRDVLLPWEDTFFG